MEKKATFGAAASGVEARSGGSTASCRRASATPAAASRTPRYEQVCTDRTGHAEVVEVTYDPSGSRTRAARTYLGRARPDAAEPPGPRRRLADRSAIFVHDEEQRAAAEARASASRSADESRS